MRMAIAALIIASIPVTIAPAQTINEPRLFLRMGGRDGYFYDQYITGIQSFSASTQQVTVETRINNRPPARIGEVCDS
jgi:hypothetical protein